MMRVEVELKVKMILDVKKNPNMDDIKNNIKITEVEIDDNMKLLSLKIIDGKVKEMF